MDFSISGLLGLLRDPGPIIEWGGLPVLALIIFLETGALVAFLASPAAGYITGSELHVNGGMFLT